MTLIKHIEMYFQSPWSVFVWWYIYQKLNGSLFWIDFIHPSQTADSSMAAEDGFDEKGCHCEISVEDLLPSVKSVIRAVRWVRGNKSPTNSVFLDCQGCVERSPDCHPCAQGITVTTIFFQVIFRQCWETGNLVSGSINTAEPCKLTMWQGCGCVCVCASWTCCFLKWYVSQTH